MAGWRKVQRRDRLEPVIHRNAESAAATKERINAVRRSLDFSDELMKRRR